jgi:hypothetical protein
MQYDGVHGWELTQYVEVDLPNEGSKISRGSEAQASAGGGAVVATRERSALVIFDQNLVADV